MRKALRIPALILSFALLTGCGSSADSSSKKSTGTTVPETTTTTTEPEVIEPRVIEYDPDKPVLALTFDDGPNTTITPRVLDLLEKYDAAGTFFLIGQNINEESAESVKRAWSLGCQIESHSFTHSYMNKMEAADIIDEMDRTDALIKDLTGTEPTFFRPPYFAVNDVMYDSIDKTFITGFGVDDWDSSVTVEQRIDGVMSLAQDGAIILLHDAEGNYQTVEALETLIPQLQEQGYQLVTVSQLFEAKGKDPASEEFRHKVISLVE